MDRNKKWTDEALEWIASEVDSLDGMTWEEKADYVKAAVKDRFDIALENAAMLRSAYRRAKGIHDTNRKTKEKLSEIDSLNRLFPDDDPETFKKDGKTYVVFRVKRTEEMSGETFVEPVSIPLDTIDSIFQDYALHGDNLTGQQVCDKYGLSGKAWNAIRSRMNLNKLSSVRSDVTLREMSDEGHEAIASQHVMNRTKQRMREAHDKEVKRLLLITSSTENYLNFVRSKIEGYKPISVKLPKAKRPENDNVLSIVMSDIHLGRVGSEETVRRLARIQTDAILASENVIHVDFLGDLAETFVQDGMHPGQIADMDGRWGRGFDLMMNVVGTLETFLIEMAKAGKRVHFTGITGNHDRATQGKEYDVERTHGLLVYELLKRGLDKTEISVDYLRERVNTMDRGGLRIIAGHGDGRPFDKQRPSDIILKHGRMDKYNVIVSGDKHHFKMEDVHDKGVWIKTRALAVPGRYEKEQDYQSFAGYLKIKEEETGKPSITIATL